MTTYQSEDQKADRTSPRELGRIPFATRMNQNTTTSGKKKAAIFSRSTFTDDHGNANVNGLHPGITFHV